MVGQEVKATLGNLATNPLCTFKEKAPKALLSLTISAGGQASWGQTGSGRSDLGALLADVLKPSL